jgi:hypothetical protein
VTHPPSTHFWRIGVMSPRQLTMFIRAVLRFSNSKAICVPSPPSRASSR